MGRHFVGRRTGMSRTRVKLAIAVAVLGVVVTATAAVAGGGGKTNARLSGFEEVPAVMTTGEGKLKLKISRTEQRIDYVLTYSGLEGGNALFAHIHIGQRTANGGVAAFLCGGGSKPPCPATAGTVSGTIVPADVQAIPTQGLDAGEFAELVRAIRAGVTYANVHTPRSPAGEIRGQIGGKNGHGNGHGGDDDD
jgi:hypothetical protein